MVTFTLVTEETDEPTLKSYGLKKESGKYYKIVSDGAVTEVAISLEEANAHANRIDKQRRQKTFKKQIQAEEKRNTQSKWAENDIKGPK